MRLQSMTAVTHMFDVEAHKSVPGVNIIHRPPDVLASGPCYRFTQNHWLKYPRIVNVYAMHLSIGEFKLLTTLPRGRDMPSASESQGDSHTRDDGTQKRLRRELVRFTGRG
jgi:hypothetical protein